LDAWEELSRSLDETEIYDWDSSTTEETVLSEAGSITEQELLDLMLVQYIFDRDGNLVQFVPFPHQERLLDLVFGKMRQKLPIRYYVCKARQLGFSTLIELIIYCLCSSLPGRRAMVAAHEIEASKEVFDTCQVIHDHTENPKPLSHRSIRGLAFAPPHYSRIKIDTANNKHLGRAGRLNYVHVTELAMWERPKKPMAALRQCVPYREDTMMFYESTAQGPGDYFHSRYIAAMERRVEAEALFVDWKGFPYYSLPAMPEQDDRFTEAEKDYIKEFDLTPDEAEWYVYTLHDQCDGDQDTFDKEFPMSAERAFAASGEGWFDSKAIRWMMRKQGDDDPHAIAGMIREPVFRGEIMWLEEGEAETPLGENLVEFIENPRGSLTVWKWVEEGRLYIISGDICEARNQDWHAFHVYALPKNPDERPELVAKYRNCLMDTLGAADIMARLGHYYNTALLAPERNAAGVGVVDYLKRIHYPNIYRDQGTLGQVRQKISVALGFRTGANTKRPALDEAKRLVNGLSIIIHCPETLTELQGFRMNPETHKWEQANEDAVTGRKNDDEVTALGIFALVYYRYGNRKWFTSYQTAEV